MKTKKLKTARGDARPTTSNLDRSPIGKADEFKLIARTALHPDPDQPRKTFTEASLDEMALSQMEQGIVQPLVVRLVKARYKVLEPDLESTMYRVIDLITGDTPWTGVEYPSPELTEPHLLIDRYVLVFGERRWWGAHPREIKTADGIVKWAGLDMLPCLVRDLDLDAKFKQQIIENNQREGVNDIEEAEAMDREFNRRKALDDAFSKEAMAKELGMSRADFYGTLVLTRLHPPTRQALLEGKISTSVAKEVAKVPTPTAQTKLIKTLTNEDAWQYPYSVRDTQKLIDEEYCKQLSSAPFDTNDEFLITGSPMIVGGSCKACDFRTGNMAGDFPDLKNKPNVCTKPECFKAKTDAAWKITQAESELKGIKTLTEDQYEKKRGEFVAADETNYRSAGYKSWGTLMGKHKPKPVLVQTEEGVKELFSKEEAMLALKANGVQLSGGSSDPDRKRMLANQKKEKELLATAHAATPAILKKLVGEGEPKLSTALWRLLARAAYDETNIDTHDFVLTRRGLSQRMNDSRAAAEKWLKEDHTSSECAQFIVELLLCARWAGGSWQRIAFDDDFTALCKLAGGTPEKLAAAESKLEEKGGFWDEKKYPANPPTKKKFTISASAKARIAAAAKARWAKIKAAKK